MTKASPRRSPVTGGARAGDHESLGQLLEDLRDGLLSAAGQAHAEPLRRELQRLHARCSQALDALREEPTARADAAAQQDAPPTAPDVRPAGPPAPGRETGPAVRTILLVDDEPFARSAARRVLHSIGHRVLEAPAAREAYALADSEEPIDLLLTDVNMPGVNGFELARSLEALRPGLRILYMCGYPPETIEGAPKNAQFIEKPFTFEDLVQKVELLLDAPRCS